MTLFEASLGRGNSKVGRLPTFSLPSRFTCPGATPWCIEHCYALRFERMFDNCRRAYTRNLVLTWDPGRFVQVMDVLLPPDSPWLRIHVSGDFYSAAYANLWRRICETRPHTRFWAYTRSWTVASIRPALEQLRALPNVQLFASVDTDMPSPPRDWRTAYIEIDTRAVGMPCRHQHGRVESCLDCGYCFIERAGDVVFKVH